VPYDVAKAKALLKEAGLASGLSFTIKTPQMAYASRSAELLAAMFAEVGVDAKIVPTEFPAKWIEEVFRAKDFDMTIVAHAEPLDIEIYGRETYYFNYKSQPFRDLMADIARTTDDKARMPSTPRRRRCWRRTCRPCSCFSCRSSASGTPS